MMLIICPECGGVLYKKEKIFKDRCECNRCSNIIYQKEDEVDFYNFDVIKELFGINQFAEQTIVTRNFTINNTIENIARETDLYATDRERIYKFYNYFINGNIEY